MAADSMFRGVAMREEGVLGVQAGVLGDLLTSRSTSKYPGAPIHEFPQNI